MFERFHGGTFVRGGTYFGVKDMEFVSVPAEGDYLPGGEEETFIRVPLIFTLALGPVLGLLFVIFLPFAVPIVIGMLLVQRIRRRAPELRDAVFRATTYGQQPGMVYLHMKDMGRKRAIRELKEPGEARTESKLEELIARFEEDIARRREAGEK